LDYFTEALTDKDPLLQEFGVGGLANICLGNINRQLCSDKGLIL
jgi:hypothetical protein